MRMKTEKPIIYWSLSAKKLGWNRLSVRSPNISSKEGRMWEAYTISLFLKQFFFSFPQTAYNICKLFVWSALINVFPFILRSSLSSLSWFSIRHITAICMGMLFSWSQNWPQDICAWNNVQIQIGLLNINNRNNNNNNKMIIRQYAGFKYTVQWFL